MLVGNKNSLWGKKETPESDKFITNWDFTANEYFQIPTTFGYNFDYYVDWGDGSEILHVTSAQTGNAHTYINAGNYDIKIWGIFEEINCFGLAQLKDIKQWGKSTWYSMSFSGCTGLTDVTCVDKPIFGVGATLTNLFKSCSNLTNVFKIEYWDVSNVVSLDSAFYSAAYFNQSLSFWNVSNVTSLNTTFYRAARFNSSVNDWDTSSVTNFYACFGYSAYQQPLDNWSFVSATSATLFFRERAYNTPYYDALLISLDAQTLNSGWTLGMGKSKYTLGGAAETARTSLIAKGITINDLGGI